MFTGIITNLGVIESITRSSKKDLVLQIATPKKFVERKLEIGCSIACNGVCLTLINKKSDKEKIIFSFQASRETCDKTTLKNWKIGQEINLEFALRVGDELGGHLVLGHVDDIAEITEIKKLKDSHRFSFKAPKQLTKFISEKGSVTLDGISLTINQVKNDIFTINAIEHTFNKTALKNAQVQDKVNLEIDALARYVSKLIQTTHD